MHAGAFRTAQWLAEALQEVQGGMAAAEGSVRAKQRLVVTAEASERDAKAVFDATAEAFKAEQEAVGGMETSVRKAEQVCIPQLSQMCQMGQFIDFSTLKCQIKKIEL